VVDALDYLDPAFLKAAIARSASPNAVGLAGDSEEGTDVDLRIAVSRFTREYVSSLTGIALVGLGLGVGLDLSASPLPFGSSAVNEVRSSCGDSTLTRLSAATSDRRCSSRQARWTRP
jgi:hypothetical protein